MASKAENELAKACNQVLFLASKVASEKSGTNGASVGEAAGLALVFLAAAAQGADEYFNGRLRTEAVDGNKKS